MISGSHYYQNYRDVEGELYINSTGSIINFAVINDNVLVSDDLWERMYVRPKPVIIVCAYCKCHNVISSPACIQCGAPMGYGTERRYG